MASQPAERSQERPAFSGMFELQNAAALSARIKSNQTKPDPVPDNATRVVFNLVLANERTILGLGLGLRHHLKRRKDGHSKLMNLHRLQVSFIGKRANAKRRARPSDSSVATVTRKNCSDFARQQQQQQHARANKLLPLEFCCIGGLCLVAVAVAVAVTSKKLDKSARFLAVMLL